ncbi:MAG: hypothetical protein CFE46_11995 [Burkholderiales bacterium PBB6]|jgi:hypothetical protein|nr:MAG: hypothetical protein CFE46_11995 [Burkholderiales bacterium PBB6]
MRRYLPDSPQAAARVVALALLADGHYSREELEMLDRLDAAGQLGLSRAELHEVVHGLCEDLLYSRQLTWAEACQLDRATLLTVLDELQDPFLREQVLQLCVDVVAADRHVADGESLVLCTAMDHWHLPRQRPLHQRLLMSAC